MSQKVVFYKPVDDTKGEVTRVIFKTDGLDMNKVLSVNEPYVLVDTVPEPDIHYMKQNRKSSKLYVNLADNTISVEYYDRPSTREEQLENQVDELTIQLGDLILNGGV